MRTRLKITLIRFCRDQRHVNVGVPAAQHSLRVRYHNYAIQLFLAPHTTHLDFCGGRECVDIGVACAEGRHRHHRRHHHHHHHRHQLKTHRDVAAEDASLLAFRVPKVHRATQLNSSVCECLSGTLIVQNVRINHPRRTKLTVTSAASENAWVWAIQLHKMLYN